MSTQKITVETTIAAPISEVWRAYTTPEDIMQWNAAAHFPANVVSYSSVNLSPADGS